MEFEDRNTRSSNTSNLPLLVLLVLLAIIAAILYLGWQYRAGSADEKLTNITPDSMASAMSKEPLLEEANTNETPIKQGEEKEEMPSVPKLKTSKEEKIAKDEDEEKPKKSPEKPKEEKPKTPSGGEAYSHTIQPGETFYGVANRYNLKFSTLQNLNPDVKPEGIKSGVTKLKVRVQAVHTVGAGDILRVVAKKYGVTVEQLMATNKKEKNHTERGEKLVIPFAEKK